MQQAEKFHRPVLCFVDTLRRLLRHRRPRNAGQGQAIAENLTGDDRPAARRSSPLLIGEGGSGGALALAVADRGLDAGKRRLLGHLAGGLCQHPLEGRRPRRRTPPQCLKLTAADALHFGVIEQIIPEAALGKEAFYRLLRTGLHQKLQTLQALDPQVLLAQRYARFRRLGTTELEEPL